MRILESLSDAGDNAKDAAFTKFYEQYGTHYLSEARFGAKLVVQTRMSKSEVKQTNPANSRKHHNLCLFLGLFGFHE